MQLEPCGKIFFSAFVTFIIDFCHFWAAICREFLIRRDFVAKFLSYAPLKLQEFLLFDGTSRTGTSSDLNMILTSPIRQLKMKAKDATNVAPKTKFSPVVLNATDMVNSSVSITLTRSGFHYLLRGTCQKDYFNEHRHGEKIQKGNLVKGKSEGWSKIL